MKNKGFTLIELLAVIVILSVIALITTPIMLNVVNKVDVELSAEQKKIVLDAAKMWGVKNLSVIKKDEVYSPSKYYVTINDLIEGGFLSNEDIKEFNENMDGKVVCIRYNNKFEYSFDDLANCSS